MPKQFKFLLILILLVFATRGISSPERRIVAGAFLPGESLNMSTRMQIKNNDTLQFVDTAYVDINCDGLPDRVHSAEALYIDIMQSDSTYRFYTRLSEDKGSIAVYDFNRDSIPDILQQQEHGQMQLYLNYSMPALASEAISMSEDSIYRMIYNYQDDNRGPLLFYPSINNSAISLRSDSLGVTLIPALNWNGTAEITIAYAREGLRDTIRIPVTVYPVNDPPQKQGNPWPAKLSEDTELILHPDSLLQWVWDPDDDDVLQIYLRRQRPDVIVRDSLFVYQPPADWFGKDSLQFIVSDGYYSDTLTLHVIVESVNDAPVWHSIAPTENPEDVLLRLPYDWLYDHADDVETPDSLLRFHVYSGKHVFISVEGEGITIVSDENWFGYDSLMLTVSDGILQDTTYWRIHITPVNDPPVLTALPDTVFNEDDTLYIDKSMLELFAEDIETETQDLKWQIQSYGKIRAFYNGARVRYIAPKDWYGTDSLRLTVSDGEIAVSRTWVIHVLPVNDAPQWEFVPGKSSIPGKSFLEDNTLLIGRRELYRYISDAETPDNKLMLTVIPSPFLHIVETEKTYIISADLNWYGNADIRMIVDDGEYRDTCRCPLRVISVNDPPMIQQIPGQTWMEDDTLTLSRAYFASFALDIETKTTDLLWSFIDNPPVYIHEQSEKIKLYTKPDWNGEASVRIMIHDGGLSDTCTMDISVTAVNDAPRWLALPDTHIVEDGSLMIPMQFVRQFVTDPDIGDTINISLSGSDNVYIEEKQDTMVIWPIKDWYGTEKLSLTASDGKKTVKKTWIIPVLAVNDPPYFTMTLPDSLAFDANSSDTLIFKDVVYDIDNDLSDLIWDITPGRNVRYLIDDKLGGIIFFTENYKFGDDAVTIRVTDGHDMIVYYLPVYVHEVNRFLTGNPEKLTLLPNSPNPFTESTEIRYSLPVSCQVSIKIYNLLGKEIKNMVDAYHEPRNYSVRWYGENNTGMPAPSGVYLCRMVAVVDGEPIIIMQKMMLVR